MRRVSCIKSAPSLRSPQHFIVNAGLSLMQWMPRGLSGESSLSSKRRPCLGPRTPASILLTPGGGCWVWSSDVNSRRYDPNNGTGGLPPGSARRAGPTVPTMSLTTEDGAGGAPRDGAPCSGILPCSESTRTPGRRPSPPWWSRPARPRPGRSPATPTRTSRPGWGASRSPRWGSTSRAAPASCPPGC